MSLTVAAIAGVVSAAVKYLLMSKGLETAAHKATEKIGEMSGEALVNAGKNALTKLRQALAQRGDAARKAQKALADVEDDPSDEDYQRKFATELDKLAAQDAHMHTLLEQLSTEVEKHTGTSGRRTHHQFIGGNAHVGAAVAGDVHGSLTLGPVTFGDQIDGRSSQGLINRPSGAINQHADEQRKIKTIGGDAEGIITHRDMSGAIPEEVSVRDILASGTLINDIDRGAGAATLLASLLEVPPKVALGADALVVVRLTHVPAHMRSTVLEARIEAHGFEMLDTATSALALDASGTGTVQFVVRAGTLGTQALRVDFMQHDQVIDSAFASTRVVTSAEFEAPATHRRELRAAGAAVDLELRITIDPDDEHLLRFTLHSPNHHAPFHGNEMGEVPLRRAPRETLEQVYAELSGLARAQPSTAHDVTANQHIMAQIGHRLWEELFPSALKDAYWRIDDAVQTLQITSDEPWIPWEMIKPYRFDHDSTRDSAPFLCERFSIARWLTQTSVATSLQVSRVQPVAPRASDLAHVQTELEMLRTLARTVPTLEVAAPITDPEQIVVLFNAGAMHVLHIAAHGGFDSSQPDNATIHLTGGPLKPSDITAWFDGGARARPLVFINACHGARADFAFTGLGGWADRLVRRTHVGAFVGAAWEVDDRLAVLFAQTFYAAFVRDSETIGESFRQARMVVRDAAPANSTWLAYVLYADPLARAVLPEPA